jgi:hypothetical protein
MLDLDTSRIYSCSILPELPGCAGFQPASGATGGLLNQEEAMDATPARMMMWFAAFPRLLPLIPPAPFSHTGLKGGGFAGRLSTVSVPPNARADPSVS